MTGHCICFKIIDPIAGQFMITYHNLLRTLTLNIDKKTDVSDNDSVHVADSENENVAGDDTPTESSSDEGPMAKK